RISESSGRSADLVDTLVETDLLITDYSSIDDDFLVLDRPIVYAPYDYEAFERMQGFFEPYVTSRAGPVADSFEALCELLAAASNGTDMAPDQRAVRRALAHQALDGMA